MKLRKQRAGPLALVESIGAPTTPKYWRAGLAQLVEHLICNQGVAGSNPAAGTIFSINSNALCVNRMATKYPALSPRNLDWKFEPSPDRLDGPSP
jgi:hypothetical protein